MTAVWKDRYSLITFRVDGQPYCDALVDNKTYMYSEPPVSPILTSSDKVFLGWGMLPHLGGTGDQ